MDKKKLLLLLFFMVAVAQVASAANIFDQISNNQLLQNFDPNQLITFYARFWWIIDLVVYAIILSTAIKIGTKNQFEGKGQALAGVFAFILALGAVIFEARTDFRLGNLGALGIGVAMLILGKGIWDITGGLGLGKGRRVVFALLYLALYGLLILPLTQSFRGQENLNLIPLAADILALIAIVMVFMGIWGLGRSMFRGGGGGDGGGGLGGDSVAAARDMDALKVEDVETKERAAELAEEAREFNDARIIDGISQRELKCADAISRDLSIIIKVLRNAVKRRSVDGKAVQAVQAKVQELMGYSNQIKGLQPELEAKIIELERLAVTEKAQIEATRKQTTRELKDELVAKKKTTQGKLNKAIDLADLSFSKRKSGFEADAQRRINDQINATKAEWAIVKQIDQISRDFELYFRDAYAKLSNDIPGAILELEKAKKDVDKIKQLTRLQDIEVRTKINPLIRRRLNDLKNEKMLAVRTQLGLKQQRNIIQRTKGLFRRR